jgi:hypothetical protein
MSRRRLRADDGAAVIVTLIVLLLIFALAGTVMAQALAMNGDVRVATGSQRAFQAAQSGIDRALGRINVLKPADAQCVTDVVTAPQPDGWCANTTEMVGNGEAYSYRVTPALASGAPCAGDPLPNTAISRCIVSVGTADGQQARIRTRVAVATTTTPFSSQTSVIGYSEVKLKKSAKITGVAKTNKKLRLDGGASLNGYTPEVGPKAKIKGYTGPVTRLPANMVPALPDFWMTDPATGQRRDTAVWNDNPTLVNAIIANPRVTYSGPVTRELVIGDNVQVTIPAGIYNFCKLTLGKNAKITIAPLKITDPSPKDAVRIYIDSKDRAGSQCRSAGQLDAKANASFLNPNDPEPRSLQIYAWSKRTKLKIPAAQKVVGLIYAPLSKVSFNSKKATTFLGGIAADKVEIPKSMTAQFSNNLMSWTVSRLNASQVIAWNQCPGTITAADPQAGC